jgi:hypothetical protein
MDDAFVRAQHGNVNIYSIDPAGLGGLQAFLEKRTTVTQADRVTRGATPMVPVRSNLLDAYQTARMSRDYLRTVAENTAGAIPEINDVTAGVAQIFRENSSYYPLGYRSTRGWRPPNAEGGREGAAIRRDCATGTRLRSALAAEGDSRRRSSSPTRFRRPAQHQPSAHSRRRCCRPDRSAVVAITVGIEHTVPGDVGARVDMLQLVTTALAAPASPCVEDRER